MTPLDRAARAVFETRSVRHFSDGSPITWEKAKNNFHNGSITRAYREARAALEALLDVTPEMLTVFDKVGIDQDPRDYWQAMLRHVLDEGKGKL